MKKIVFCIFFLLVVLFVAPRGEGTMTGWMEGHAKAFGLLGVLVFVGLLFYLASHMGWQKGKEESILLSSDGKWHCRLCGRQPWEGCGHNNNFV